MYFRIYKGFYITNNIVRDASKSYLISGSDDNTYRNFRFLAFY